MFSTRTNLNRFKLISKSQSNNYTLSTQIISTCWSNRCETVKKVQTFDHEFSSESIDILDMVLQLYGEFFACNKNITSTMIEYMPVSCRSKTVGLCRPHNRTLTNAASHALLITAYVDRAVNW